MPESADHPSMQRLLTAAAAMERPLTSKSAVAVALGESAQTLTNWSNRGVSKQGALNAQRRLGIGSAWILDGTGPMLVSMPQEFDPVEWTDIVGYAQAVGLGYGAEAQEYAETHKLKFRADSLARKRLNASKLAVMYGQGDSMLPRIHPGDAILFDLSDTRPRDEALFVIQTHGIAGSEYSVKRCRDLDGIIFFDALNPAGDHNWRKPRRMDDKRHPITILGRVRWIGSWED